MNERFLSGIIKNQPVKEAVKWQVGLSFYDEIFVVKPTLIYQNENF
jgi:hypothetical protein